MFLAGVIGNVVFSGGFLRLLVIDIFYQIFILCESFVPKGNSSTLLSFRPAGEILFYCGIRSLPLVEMTLSKELFPSFDP